MSTVPSIDMTTDPIYKDFPLCGDIMAEIAYLVIVLILSVSGNIFMVSISLKDSNLRGGILPLISLAVGEVIYVFITTITAFFVMGDMRVVHFIRRHNICTFLGTLNLILVQFDLATHGILGLIRYMAICHPIKYRKYVTLRNSIIITIFNIFYATIMGYLSSVVQYENEYIIYYTLDPSALNCMMKLGKMGSSYICVFYFGPPIMVAGVSYIMCFRKLRSSGSSIVTITNNQKRLSVTLGTSFTVVFLQSCFYPLSIVIYEGKEHLCYITRRHFTWMILQNSLVNPIAFLSMYAYKRKYLRPGFVSTSIKETNQRH